MDSNNKLTKSSPQQPVKNPDNLKDVLQFAADITGDAKKAAEENPFTSSGKPKASLKGAAAITNRLKEEGIEAHKRGIVSTPNMVGGLKNNDMHTAAEAALKVFDLFEQQSKSLPDKPEE